ncbi:MAG: hydroxymethylbilane synthase [Mobilicoccus sp.]|nr:hydroxymethylbilane synthase [Mobilicoccus sp.]
MSRSVLRLGTRRSTLATTQSGWVADLLRARGHEVELVEIVTEGDVNHAPLTQIGGTGVFASALRGALHSGEVDFAVHSLKDLPTQPEPGLVVAGIPEREDVRDVLVADGHTLSTLPQGARVGTGSPRRAAQLMCHRPDLAVRAIRGNVERRISFVRSGELDAVVLAGAGIRRLGRTSDVAEFIDPAIMLPAPGQGALAIECRADAEVAEAIAELDDAVTRACVTAERALLRALEAGCTAPIGALATLEGDELVLEGFAGSDDGTIALRRSARGALAEPEALGAALATDLLDAGADGIAASVLARSHERHAPPVAGGTNHDGPTAAVKEQKP